MEPKVSSPCSQEHATCPYPEPDQSSTCLFPLYVLKINFNIIFSFQMICPSRALFSTVCKLVTFTTWSC